MAREGRQVLARFGIRLEVSTGLSDLILEEMCEALSKRRVAGALRHKVQSLMGNIRELGGAVEVFIEE